MTAQLAEGLAAYAEKRFGVAIAALRRYLASRPHHPQALFYAGLSYREMHRWAEAHEHFARLLRVQPGDAGGLLYMGITLQNLHRWEEALMCFDLLLMTQTDHIEANLYRGICLQNLRRWDEAYDSFEAVLRTNPSHADAVFQAAYCRQQQQRWSEAIQLYRNMTVLRPEDPQAWLSLGYVSEQLERWRDACLSYDTASLLGRQQASVADQEFRTKVNYRHFPTDYPPPPVDLDHDRFARQILNNLNGVPPQYSELPLRSQGHRTVLLAAMPKSASTFLSTCLSLLFECPHVPLSFHFDRSEQDLYLPTLLYHSGIDTVSQLHLRATQANTKLINLFGIKTVVLVRNLADVLVSFRDHVLKEGPVFAGCYLDKSFLDLDKDAQYDMLVDLAAPWFVHFYVSWERASTGGQVDVHWLTYEELTADPVGRIAAICTLADVERSPTNIQDAIARASRQATRFNIGAVGRGVTELGLARVERLQRLTTYYPGVDFSRVGLAPVTHRG